MAFGILLSTFFFPRFNRNSYFYILCKWYMDFSKINRNLWTEWQKKTNCNNSTVMLYFVENAIVVWKVDSIVFGHVISIVYAHCFPIQKILFHHCFVQNWKIWKMARKNIVLEWCVIVCRCEIVLFAVISNFSCTFWWKP